jgi:transcriptional regulator with XRE-family HTH domain
MSKHRDVPTIDRARLRAVLALRGLSITSLAASVGISARHLELVTSGRRPLTQKVAEGIQRAIGADAWDFITGKAGALDAVRGSCSTGGEAEEEA